MIQSTRASLTARIAVLAASLACASLLAGPVAAGAATIVYAPESFSVYEQQLNSGKIRAVTINKRVRSLRVTLDDGTYVLARYKPKQEKQAAAALEAKHVPVVVLSSSEAGKEAKSTTKKKPAKHKIRYIAAGVLIIVIIVVAAVLLIRRRRYRDDY
jgi:hypothetical protein